MNIIPLVSRIKTSLEKKGAPSLLHLRGILDDIFSLGGTNTGSFSYFLILLEHFFQ